MNKAQSTLEFTLAFVMTILFIVFTVNAFVWINHCMVRRQVAYEESRSQAGGSADPNPIKAEKEVGKANFYTPPRLSVFSKGGIGK